MWRPAEPQNIMTHSLLQIEGVHLPQLKPFTTLLVRTRNSLYRIVVSDGSRVYVQGGTMFPDATPAYVDGAYVARNVLKLGWIVVGLAMEMRTGERRVLTSPVRAITREQSPATSVH
jgi:hypothetical protein